MVDSRGRIMLYNVWEHSLSPDDHRCWLPFEVREKVTRYVHSILLNQKDVVQINVLRES